MRQINTTPGYLLLLLFTLTFVIQSCEKIPVAGFSFESVENPEVGDTVFFINESIDASSFEWDFGDGQTSDQESPFVIYEYPAFFKVRLNAISKAGNDTISQIVDINYSTDLGFYVYMPDSTTLAEDCIVWIYDNEEDLFNEAEPLFFSQTDSEGLAYFERVEEIVYYVSFFKETPEGLYWFRGYTHPMELHAINLYAILLKFTPNGEIRKSEESVSTYKPLKKLSPIQKTPQTTSPHN